MRLKLRRTISGLDASFDALVAEADRLGVDVCEMRLPDGQFAAAPILAAQGQCLAALASLK